MHTNDDALKASKERALRLVADLSPLIEQAQVFEREHHPAEPIAPDVPPAAEQGPYGLLSILQAELEALLQLQAEPDSQSQNTAEIDLLRAHLARLERHPK